MSPSCRECGRALYEQHTWACSLNGTVTFANRDPLAPWERELLGGVRRDEAGNLFTRTGGREYVVGTLVVTHKDGSESRYPRVREDSIDYENGILTVEASDKPHHILDARSYTFDFS